MPAYNSTITAHNCKFIGNVPLLPLKNASKSGAKSSAPTCPDTDFDIVDESLDLYKANILFTSFEVKEKADLVMVYCILYITLCLKILAKSPNQERANSDLFAQALKRFALPGDADFPLNAYFEKPKSSADFEELKKYFTQVRQEVGHRLIQRVFDQTLSKDGKPSKWWICFARKKFLKTELSD